MAKTTRGRVVYNRKPHLFRYSDVLRIVRQVEVSKDADRKLAEVTTALAVAQAALSDYFAAIRNLVPATRLTFATRAVLLLLSELQQLASFMTGESGDLLRQVLDWFQENLIEGRRENDG